MNLGACDHQSKWTCKHLIIKVMTNVSRLSIKHESIQACDHERIQAYEHLRTQIHITLISQSPQHLSKIVKAIERMNIQLYDHFILRANRYFIIQVCTHVYGYQTCEYECI